MFHPDEVTEAVDAMFADLIRVDVTQDAPATWTRHPEAEDAMGQAVSHWVRIDGTDAEADDLDDAGLPLLDF